MDYYVPEEFGPAAVRPVAPEAWNEPVTIGVEPDSTDTDSGFVDDRFEPTGFGSGDDLGIEEAETSADDAVEVEIADTIAQGIGNTSTAGIVEVSRGIGAVEPENPADTPATQADAVNTESSADAPVPAGDGPTEVPPADPPTAKAEGPSGPERGAALYRLCDYAITTAEAEAYLTADAAEVVAEHADDLASTGLEILHGEDNAGSIISFKIVKPGDFAEALAHMPMVEDSDHGDAMRERLLSEIEQAVLDTEMTLLHSDHPSIAALGSDIEHIPVYNPVTASLAPAPEEVQFAQDMCEHAGTMADALEQQGASALELNSLRLLATAQAEGLTTEWAISSATHMHSTVAPHAFLGVFDLPTPAAWEPVFRLCEHLARTAPDATFTRAVRDGIVANITTVLDGLPDELMNSRDANGDLTQGAVYAQFNQMTRNLRQPNMLENARDRILQILP